MDPWLFNLLVLVLERYGLNCGFSVTCCRFLLSVDWMKTTTLGADLEQTPLRREPREVFVTTLWTVVLAAGRGCDSSGARAALDVLCQTYWYPLYAYVRRQGYGSHDAEDLVQGFFARLIRLNSLGDTCREKGKFRAFLLASMKHYMADVWGRESAAKRDVRKTVHLDALEAESRYALEPSDHLTPERLFERQWALSLLENVVRRLSDEYESTGRGELFNGLRFAVTGDKSEVPYVELASQLNLSEGAVRVAVHRLRQRYRHLLREEIAHTLSEGEDVASELAALRRVLS